MMMKRVRWRRSLNVLHARKYIRMKGIDAWGVD
jgi:hypothetical protein